MVIRNGLVVDGGGAPPRHARDRCQRAHRHPRFIDGHTHLDAQIVWDPQVTPSTLHGVTTVLLGNCGVSFAPCRPEHRETLAGMMETVEDIPKKAIMAGLSWQWDEYGDYLDHLGAARPAVNVVGLVGHCAVRYYVMGERAVDQPATTHEIEQMAALVHRALERGAIGYSTSLVASHRIPDGRPVPGTFASEEALCRLAEVVRDHGGGPMQLVLGIEGDLIRGDNRVTDLLRKVAAVGGNCLMTNTWVAIGWPRCDGAGDGVLLHGRFAGLAAEGHDVTGGCIPRGSGDAGVVQATTE